MKKYIFLIILSGLIATTAPIKKIIITGNHITENSVILNLLNHQIGDQIDIALAIEDQLNLYQTDLFYDVIIQPADSMYYIYVFEKPKILPRPLVDKHDILGWSYGGSLLFNNIKGQNKKLKLSALKGKTTLYDATYTNPKLYATNDSLQINVYKKYFTSIENDYILNQLGVQTSISLPKINNFHKLGISIQYEYNKLKLLTNNISENIYSIKTSLSYQKNTLSNKLLRGNILYIDYSFIYFKNNYRNYSNIKLINQYYIPLIENADAGRLVLKTKMILNFIKNIPTYNKIYIGAENYIRGYEVNPLLNNTAVQNRLKWNNIITTTIQLELPLFKKNILNTELLLFMDFGIGSNDYKVFDTANKLRSHGFGIRYEIIKFGGVDLCFGLNPYGYKIFHVIVNFKNF